MCRSYSEKVVGCLLYARSDVCAISVPVTSGGCGDTHSRPVRNGIAARTWGLDCDKCCSYLSGYGRPRILKVTPGDVKSGILPVQERVADSDPQWSSVPDAIPMTPDEIRSDRHFRDTAQLQINAMNALGTAMANGLQIPPEMMYLLRKQLPPEMLVQGSIVCAKGHDNTPGAKFCGECGMGMDARAEITMTPSARTGDDSIIPLEQLHVATLKKKARSLGIPDRGSKDQLVTAIRNAG